MKTTDIMNIVSNYAAEMMAQGWKLRMMNTSFSAVDGYVALEKDGMLTAFGMRYKCGFGDIDRMEIVRSTTEVYKARFGRIETNGLFDDDNTGVLDTFYKVGRDWYVEDKAEAEECDEKRFNRYKLKAKPDKKLKPTKAFMDGFVRNHKGFKTSKIEDIEIKHQEKGWGCVSCYIVKDVKRSREYVVK